MKKILITTPLCVPSYFNAGHRLALYEVAAYVRTKGHTVVVSEIAALNVTWKDLADFLIQNTFDLIAVQNDYDLIEGFGRFCQYVREFSPQAKIVTFGRLSSSHASFFHQFNIDGVVSSGDYEPGVDQFINFIDHAIAPAGVDVKTDDGWTTAQQKGILLPVEEWVLPNISEIAYSSYYLLYSSDQRKFCGIPDRREFVVPLARGCPVGCDFCEVWPREGLKERRLSVATVMRYIEESFSRQPFEYVSMYAPTFTLKKKWVRDLCAEFISRGNKYPWKCTTTMFHLDEELVKLMGSAGCFRISIGLESLEDSGLQALPSQKHNAKQKFDELHRWCTEAGIELNCFVIVGLPGTTVEGTREMFAYLRERNARVRPSILADYTLLTPETNEQDALKILGRHILPSNTHFSPEERQQLYQLVFGAEPNLTKVMESIPKHA